MTHGGEAAPPPPDSSNPATADMPNMPGMPNTAAKPSAPAMPGTSATPKPDMPLVPQKSAPAKLGMAEMHDMAKMPGHEEPASGNGAAGAMPAEHEGMDATMSHDQGVPWPHFANMILGVWLITTAFALGLRSTGMQVSDIASGAVVIVLAILSLAGRPLWKLWSPWANALVGVWLLFAPLVLWSPTAAGYANDTLAGVLVIVFAILAPGMPMAPGMTMEPGPDIPEGWSYNPSSWPQRAPIIALALVGFFLSRQMAAFELGHVTTFTDPFFGDGTESVLTSDVSRMFPVADAGLGAVAYLVEFLMGFMGDKRRWRTMPWMVTFFGILVVPLGIVSITLIILQPLAVGSWCTPCLIAAAAMLVMIALTLDEVVAMLQFLVQARREGQSVWRTFWLGGALKDLPVTVDPVHQDVVSAQAMIWGVALPWNLVLSVGLGLWLMASPAIYGSDGTAAHSDHLIGALAVTVAMVALSDVGRATRFLNIAFGAWFIVAPWLLGGSTFGSTWNDVAIGVALIMLSLPRGRVGEGYGSWGQFIR
jgi:uncharacterized membrane protein